MWHQVQSVYAYLCPCNSLNPFWCCWDTTAVLCPSREPQTDPLGLSCTIRSNQNTCRLHVRWALWADGAADESRPRLMYLLLMWIRIWTAANALQETQAETVVWKPFVCLCLSHLDALKVFCIKIILLKTADGF